MSSVKLEGIEGVAKICANCEFNMGGVCGGRTEGYGEAVDDDGTCEEWEISFAVYQDLD